MENIKDTIELMNSNHYENRFIAEYWQLKIRYDRLHNLLVKYDSGTLEFKPSCPISLLRRQAKNMGKYLYDLEVRAEIEHINLNSYK